MEMYRHRPLNCRRYIHLRAIGVDCFQTKIKVNTTFRVGDSLILIRLANQMGGGVAPNRVVIVDEQKKGSETHRLTGE